MLAYLYLSRRTLTGEVFPASSSTGEAASRARPLSTQRRPHDAPPWSYCWASARSPHRSQRG